MRIIFHGVVAFKFDSKIHGNEIEFLVAFARADNGLIIEH